MKQIDIDSYCEERALLPPEKDMVHLLATQGMPPDSPVMMKIMAYQAIELLFGLEMGIVSLEGWYVGATESPAAKDIANSSLSAEKTLNRVQMMLIEQIKGMKETKNGQGLRLGRLWGKLHVRDNNEGPLAQDYTIPESDEAVRVVRMIGFVGYELGETIYIETNPEIAQKQIDDFYARRTFKKRNGRTESDHG